MALSSVEAPTTMKAVKWTTGCPSTSTYIYDIPPGSLDGPPARGRIIQVRSLWMDSRLVPSSWGKIRLVKVVLRCLSSLISPGTTQRLVGCRSGRKSHCSHTFKRRRWQDASPTVIGRPRLGLGRIIDHSTVHPKVTQSRGTNIHNRGHR